MLEAGADATGIFCTLGVRGAAGKSAIPIDVTPTNPIIARRTGGGIRGDGNTAARILSLDDGNWGGGGHAAAPDRRHSGRDTASRRLRGGNLTGASATVFKGGRCAQG